LTRKTLVYKANCWYKIDRDVLGPTIS